MAFTVVPVLLLIIVISDGFPEAPGPQPQVQAKFGKVIGKSFVFDGGKHINVMKTVDAYMSIPYAEPPVGQLRFKPPVPKSWTEVESYDATEHKAACMQPDLPKFLPIHEEFNEDCLHLDVYTPNPRPINSPVMVFIHGGGFNVGTGTSFSYSQVPMVAVGGDLVAVNINYRLNVFGFFSTGNDVIPGNMGLKDQVLALRWVQDNIAEFGGDPNKVTIYGESAGSISVTYHMVSPMSKSLFNGAIMQSGTHMSSLYNRRDTKDLQRSRSFAFGRTLGCDQTNANDLVTCLQAVDAETLLANCSMNTAIENGELPQVLPFVPNADGEFLPDDPDVLFNDPAAINDVPSVMLGTLSNEGSIFTTMIYPKDSINRTEFEFAVDSFLWDYIKGEITRATVTTFYLNDEQLHNNKTNHLNAFNQLLGDFYFVCPTMNTARNLVAAAKEVFLYQIIHIPSRSIWNIEGLGPTHAEDLLFVFGMHYNEQIEHVFGELNEEDVKLTHAILTYWSNFVKTGDPNNSGDDDDDVLSSLPVWPKFTLPERNFKKLSVSMLNSNILKNKECKLLKDILPKISFLEGAAAKEATDEAHEKTKYTCQSGSCEP